MEQGRLFPGDQSRQARKKGFKCAQMPVNQQIHFSGLSNQRFQPVRNEKLNPVVSIRVYLIQGSDIIVVIESETFIRSQVQGSELTAKPLP